MKRQYMEKRKWWEFDSAMLHILAMILMLLDHSWALLFFSQRWMTAVGRVAFPIFAFMIAEGYVHTHDLKMYMKRMLIFALISEIPFNLMTSGNLIGPFHQNVMWTFLLALCGMRIMDGIKTVKNKPVMVVLLALVVIASYVIGLVTFVDYYGVGILTVYTFYFFRDRRWWCLPGQFLVLYWLNVELLGGYSFFIHPFGIEIEIVEQGLALLALIPIWLYRGKQGLHSKGFKRFCYWFYPVHMLLIYLIAYYG